MKIKKSLLAILALSSVTSVAYADVTVASNDKGSLEIYGIADAAIASQNKSLSISPSLPNQIYPYQATSAAHVTNSVTGMINGGLSDSRFGIKGHMDLDGGTKVMFNLESGIDITSGQLNNAAASLAANPKLAAGSGGQVYNSVNADSSVNGQIFNRTAWFGISDPTLGKLSFGLQNNPMKDVFGSYDPVKSDTFSPFGESGAVGGGGGISEEARMQNSVEYSNMFGGGFNVNLAYQFGNNTGSTPIGAAGSGNGYAFRFGYENDTFGVQAVYNNFKDAIKAVQSGGSGGAFINGVAAATTGDIGIKLYDTDAYLLAGKYKAMPDLTLEAGYEHFNLKAPSDPTLTIASIWGYTVSDINPGFTAGNSQAEHIAFVGGDYNFSPKLNLSVGYYDTEADNATGSSTTAFSIKTTSAVLNYHLNKSLDTYLALTNNSFGGVAYDSAHGNDNSSVSAYGVGMRYKF